MAPRINAFTEAHGSIEHRQELLDGLHGRVIEIGAGLGSNFVHYPPEVERVVAVEPEFGGQAGPGGEETDSEHGLDLDELRVAVEDPESSEGTFRSSSSA